MGYHNRIETTDKATFITTRTRNSELWFANNPKVEEAGLALLAKVQNRYKIDLYAFGFEGSHYHTAAMSSLMNRAPFIRDLNSGIAKAVDKYTPNYSGGKLWARRYSGEIIFDDESLEDKFFYIVLQCVQDGLVTKISDCPWYNCFHDAIWGIERRFKIVDWQSYNAAKRHKPNIKIKDYTEIVTLKYKRLPGYDHLSQKEYAHLMQQKLEKRRIEVLKKRAIEKKTGVVGREALLKVEPGTPALNPKVSNINSFRPRVLAQGKNYREGMNWYFTIYYEYREAARRYLAGDFEVEFPPGTYRPPVWMVVRPTGPFSVL